ncbi:MAG TPA: carboxypeptidase-like regulatory domain-containing protein [Kofleriaceae bacterium]|nr:carboxypeptidase-like regulatory domain-containing protein [Kofleriaceae bacterium]
MASLSTLGCSSPSVGDPPGASDSTAAAEAELDEPLRLPELSTRCPNPAPVPDTKCVTVVCQPDGVWVSQPLPTPRACDSFLGPNTSHCTSIGVCLPIPTGKIHPKYYVLNVVYAPPGNGGGGARSSVTYGNGSSFGTDVKTTSSFKSGVSVTASGGLKWGPFATNLSSQYGYTKQSDNSDDLMIKKSSLAVVGPVMGPTTDGINHDADTIWLWLNPVIYANQTAAGGVEWTILQDGNTGGSMDIQFVAVGWLKNPATMDPNVASRLASYGITSADYPQILAADPFASGTVTTPDPARYVQLSSTFPYERPGPGGVSPPVSVTLINDTLATHSENTTTSHTVSTTFDAGTPMDFKAFWSAKISVSGSLTWTNSTNVSKAADRSQSAAFTVTGPSSTYVGPSDLAVYYDMIYNTFLFTPVTDTPSLTGVVRDASGQPVAHQEVTLDAGGQRFRTVTRGDGSYRFFGAPAGLGRVTARSSSVAVSVGRAARDLIMR